MKHLTALTLVALFSLLTLSAEEKEAFPLLGQKIQAFIEAFGDIESEERTPLGKQYRWKSDEIEIRASTSVLALGGVTQISIDKLWPLSEKPEEIEWTKYAFESLEYLSLHTKQTNPYEWEILKKNEYRAAFYLPTTNHVIYFLPIIDEGNGVWGYGATILKDETRDFDSLILEETG